jgi:rod shape-determining protein MreC
MIALLVVAFLLATFDVRSAGDGIGTTMRDGAQTLFAPLQDGAAAVTRPVVGFIDAISDIASLREENEDLRLENEDLQAQVQQFEIIQAEVEFLRELNDLEAPGDLPTVPARIGSPGASSYDLIRWIDKGSDDGISIGDAVIDTQGLVGRVDQVFDGQARVRLIVDPNVKVSVRDKVTNQTGIVTGDNSGLILRMFEADVVQEGDVIVTAGSRFPAGIVVGTVKETAADDAGFGLVSEVIPAVSFARLDYVKVIVGYSPLDASGAEEANEIQSEGPSGDPIGPVTDTTIADEGTPEVTP